MAAADADRLGNVVHRDVVRVVELDELDGSQHILAARRAYIGHGLAGFLHQVRHKYVQVARHHCLAVRLRPAGKIDVVQRFPRGLQIPAVVYGVRLGKRCLLHKLIGARAVEADPIILPRVGLISSVGDELVRLGEEQITLLQGVRGAVDLIDTLARYDQMDQVVVAHAGTPCVARLALLTPAVKDRELNIICVALLVGLLHLMDGHGCTSLL